MPKNYKEVASELIKYGEFYIKNMKQDVKVIEGVEYVPVSKFLSFVNLDNSTIGILADNKVSEDNKIKAKNSLKELNVLDFGRVLGGVDLDIPREGNIKLAELDNEAEFINDNLDNISEKYRGGSNDCGCNYQYVMVGKIKKCFGEECSKLIKMQKYKKRKIYPSLAVFKTKDLDKIIQNILKHTDAYNDLISSLKKFIKKYGGKYTSKNMNVLKKEAVKIINNKNVNLSSPPIKPEFKKTPEITKLLDSVIKSKKIKDKEELFNNKTMVSYMNKYEIHLGYTIEYLQSL